jgi:hypothetical protein
MSLVCRVSGILSFDQKFNTPSLFFRLVSKKIFTCCECCSVVPSWVVSLYQMMFGCGSAWTIQINIASYPTPVCMNVRSTSISGESIHTDVTRMKRERREGEKEKNEFKFCVHGMFLENDNNNNC